MRRKTQMVFYLILVVMTGCSAVTISDELLPHIIVASPTGNMHKLSPGSYQRFSINSGVSDATESDSTGKEFDAHVDRIFANLNRINRSGKKPLRLMLFVHGGLNPLESSLKRAAGSYEKILADGVYPVFVNWRSGYGTTYADHLFALRGGQRRPLQATLSSPFFFLTDFAGGFARAPAAWVEQGAFSFSSTFLKDEDALLKPTDANTNVGLRVAGVAKDTTWQRVLDASLWTITAPVKFVTTPFAYSFGKPAWDVMTRRTRELVFRSCEFGAAQSLCSEEVRPAVARPSLTSLYKVGEPIDLKFSGAKDSACLTAPNEAICSGLLSVFLKKLALRKAACGASETNLCRSEVVLVGHSMGAIVVAEVLKYFRHLNFKSIVFMGAAATSRDAMASLIPYMEDERNLDTNFYNLSLSVAAEDGERTAYGLLPNGSLLTWIDTMYGLPENELDRTFGRWENARRVFRLIPTAIAPRFHFRVFGRSEDDPIEHGDFSELRFWTETFWGEPYDASVLQN